MGDTRRGFSQFLAGTDQCWCWIPLHSPCPQSLNLRVPIRRRPPVSSMPHQHLPMTIFSLPLAPGFPTGSSLPLLLHSTTRPLHSVPCGLAVCFCLITLCPCGSYTSFQPGVSLKRMLKMPLLFFHTVTLLFIQHLGSLPICSHLCSLLGFRVLWNLGSGCKCFGI